tara:strand:- start:221 stop:925 length:705 start_codon:yes stop_codon:yes gene_type:complete
MAISAAITLTSAAGDLVTNALSLSDSTTLTKAGAATALANTSGLARKTTTTTDQYTLFYADDYTDDKAHKLYLKNTSTTPGDFFTVHIDDEKLGLMYAGDWALVPWAASSGTKEVSTFTFTGTAWATGDTVTFDGITFSAGADEGASGNLMRATKFPNWVASGTADAAAVTLTSKESRADLELDVTEFAVSDASGDGDATFTVGTVTEGLDDASNIKITPGQAANTIEYMLFYE